MIMDLLETILTSAKNGGLDVKASDVAGSETAGYFIDGTPWNEWLAYMLELPYLPAEPGTACQWENPYGLTCRSKNDARGTAVHVLMRTLPVGAMGTALCAFHSPYDVRP